MKAAFAFLLAGLTVVAPVALQAHHSFAAEYDAKKPITLTGVVTKVEWTNPHARFYIDVKDADGTVRNWNLELASPNVLMRQGWNRHSLKVGDMVTVEGSQAKDGSMLANARSVVLANGEKVFSRNANPNGNAPEPPKP
jgi:hypothetical protein